MGAEIIQLCPRREPPSREQRTIFRITRPMYGFLRFLDGEERAGNHGVPDYCGGNATRRALEGRGLIAVYHGYPSGRNGGGRVRRICLTPEGRWALRLWTLPEG